MEEYQNHRRVRAGRIQAIQRCGSPTTGMPIALIQVAGKQIECPMTVLGRDASLGDLGNWLVQEADGSYHIMAAGEFERQFHSAEPAPLAEGDDAEDGKSDPTLEPSQSPANKPQSEADAGSTADAGAGGSGSGESSTANDAGGDGDTGAK